MSTFNTLSRMMQRQSVTNTAPTSSTGSSPSPNGTATTHTSSPSQPPPPASPPDASEVRARMLGVTSAVGAEAVGKPSPGVAAHPNTNPFAQQNLPSQSTGPGPRAAAPSPARGALAGGGRPNLGPRGNSTGIQMSIQLPPGSVGAPGVISTAGMGLAGGEERERLAEIAAQQAGVKAKQSQYDFRYDDTDTLLNELQEFYPYVEMSGLGLGKEEFEKGWIEGAIWTSYPLHLRTKHISHLLNTLEHRVLSTQLSALRSLTYLIQGTFGETDGPEEQLHWVVENVKVIRECGGLGIFVGGLGEAVRRHDALASTYEQPSANRQSFSVAHQTPGDAPVSQQTKDREAAQQKEDEDSGHPSGRTPAVEAMERQLDEVNVEVGLYLGVLYFVVEVSRGDEGFGDELMTLNPPLPVYLLNLVGSLREKSAKGFPVKKLLLLVWKSLLACFGGLKEARQCVALQRETTGLTKVKPDFTKITPVGITTFRKDILIKYPTFEGPSIARTREEEKLADAVQPIPVRTSYHSSIEDGLPSAFVSRGSKQDFQNGSGQQVGSMPQPGTPAPSPLVTPPLKPKKQQYQTDQTKPFVFPFTRGDGRAGPTRLVPFAIDEADKLYGKHMHVSLGLQQLSDVRSDYIREESGLGDSGLIGFTKSTYDDDTADVEDKAWEEYQLQDWKYEGLEEQYRSEGRTAELASVRQARLSLKRLYRVELVYGAILLQSQGIVVVLLKLLLATVTANANNPNGHLPGSPAQEAPPDPAEALPPPTLEEVDVIRHREITAKAVSAIVSLLLKWFKASHIIKFQHFSSLLIDSNCLLLVLKMFGFQELMSTVSIKNDWDDQNLFRYCYLNFSFHRSGQTDDVLGQPKAITTKRSDAGDDIELISEYSWRNFFYAINFMRIVHQLTKQRPARISLLVQYKSTQILKRMLRVPHPMLQLQILKIIKSQVPFCGRKWRQSNMKTITAVYLNCKPELRDDWLAATDIDADIEEANAAEHALRALVRFYHQKRYSQYPSIPGQDVAGSGHRRANSSALGNAHDEQIGSAGLRGEPDVFPPNKTLRRRISGGINGNDAASYNIDTIMSAFLYEYEDVIGEVLGTDGATETRDGFGLLNSPRLQGPAMSRSDPAWLRLDELMRHRGALEEDVISDSESVVSIGELGTDARFNDFKNDFGDEPDPVLDQRQRRMSGNENTWAHISPALSLLPKSPIERPRRRSSSNESPLRPLGATDLNWFKQAIEDEEEPGPMPIEEGTEDEIQRGSMAVDEVEEFFNV